MNNSSDSTNSSNSNATQECGTTAVATGTSPPPAPSNTTSMGYSLFIKSIAELVDIWCPDISVNSYCCFLHTLFDSVTTRVRVIAHPESAWVYNFRALEDVQEAPPGHLTDTDSDCNADDGKLGTNGDEAQDGKCLAV